MAPTIEPLKALTPEACNATAWGSSLTIQMQTKVFQGVETTTFIDEEDSLLGFYRGTVVCKKLSDGRVILNSGGWQTATTKNRMNQFSASYCNSRFAVYQKKGEWFVIVRSNDMKLPFFDGIII